MIPCDLIWTIVQLIEKNILWNLMSREGKISIKERLILFHEFAFIFVRGIFRAPNFLNYPWAQELISRMLIHWDPRRWIRPMRWPRLHRSVRQRHTSSSLRTNAAASRLEAANMFTTYTHARKKNHAEEECSSSHNRFNKDSNRTGSEKNEMVVAG